MSAITKKGDNIPTVTISSPNRSDSSGSGPLKSPRTARFAEATAVYSPIEPSQNPFRDPPTTTNHFMAQPQVSDIGFGYMNRPNHESVEMPVDDAKYLAPMTPKPLKSALKSPGAPPKNLEAILSPTFQEEEHLEKAEKDTDKMQRRDLKSKIRVRWAKFIMRGVNFGCSLIVLAMLSTVLTIFHATKGLAPRSGLPAWAPKTAIWPQVVLLTIACISLVLCIFIFYQYWKGGHRRAEKVAVYYTTFTVAFFVFSIIMWAVGAFILNQTRNNGKGQDMWGWSCKENQRKQFFEKDVPYSLLCRLQNWALVCAIIEIVIEVITIVIYGITFYRYYSKRRLRKTMAARDRARSDLYLAQLKMQSAPNTPGLPGGLLSPRDGGWRPPQGYETYNSDRKSEMSEKEDGNRYITVNENKVAQPKPFTLMAAPLSKPKPRSDSTPASPAVEQSSQRFNDHVAAAPGETQYATVAIPGAYAAPMSPAFAPQR